MPGVDGRVLVALALAACAVGLGGYAVLGADASGARLLLALVVLRVGYAAANAALGREAVAHMPPAKTGMGSGANNTARYLGAAVGVTLVVLVVGAGSPADELAGWDRAALGGAVLTPLGALPVALIRPRSGQRP